jgi:hypothetical protein
MSLGSRILSAAISAALLLLATPAAASPPQPTPSATRSERLEQGSVLEALTAVRLRGATLAPGAQVHVVAIQRRGRAPVAASLQLADGYVMKQVALSELIGKFRIRTER